MTYRHPRWTRELITAFERGDPPPPSGYPPRFLDYDKLGFAWPGTVDASEMTEADFHDAIGLD